MLAGAVRLSKFKGYWVIGLTITMYHYKVQGRFELVCTASGTSAALATRLAFSGGRATNLSEMRAPALHLRAI